MDLEALDLKGKILVVRVPDDVVANDARAMLSEAYDDLAEAGCMFSMILTPDVGIEAIDEEQMAMHGWFKGDAAPIHRNDPYTERLKNDNV